MMNRRKNDAKPWVETRAAFAAPLAKMFLAARTLISARESSLFARPWMTVGLLAVNLALVAVVVDFPPPAQAQVGPPPMFCNPCFQGLRYGGAHHAMWRFKPAIGRTVLQGYFDYRHDPDGVYLGACEVVHPTDVCCVPN